jgi:hypothetical protein
MPQYNGAFKIGRRAWAISAQNAALYAPQQKGDLYSESGTSAFALLVPALA